MNWDPYDIMKQCEARLQSASDAMDQEQQPKGLDSLTEKQIQEILGNGWEEAGLIALRELPFPSIRRKGANFSQRERCDVVLLPPETTGVRDASVKPDEPSPSLFLADSPTPPPLLADPSDAFWLELKVLGQFEYRSGVPGPNRQYGTRLVKALHDDLQKLEDDALVRWGGVLDVLFVAEEGVAQHDMKIALDRCIDRQLIPGTVITGQFPLADRIGNRLCSLWLTLVRRT